MKRFIAAASNILAWAAGAALLAMALVTVVDVVGRYGLGKPFTAGHATVQALVFAVVCLGLPMLSSMRAFMRVELLDTALPQPLARVRNRLIDGASACCLAVFGLQFLWQGRYYAQQGEYLEIIEVPLAYFGYLGGALCLIAALLAVAGRFAPTPPTKR